MSENAPPGQPPQIGMKRRAEKQLTKDNAFDDEEPSDQPVRTFNPVAPEVVAERKRQLAERIAARAAAMAAKGQPSSTAAGVFSGIARAPAAPTALAKLSTGFAAANLNASSPSTIPTNVFGSGTKFQFSLNAPPKSQSGGQAGEAEAGAAPSSPTSGGPSPLLRRPGLSSTEAPPTSDPADKEIAAGTVRLYIRKDDAWSDLGDATMRVVFNDTKQPPAGLVALVAAKTFRTVVSAAFGGALVLGKLTDTQLTFACAGPEGSGPKRYAVKSPTKDAALLQRLGAALADCQAKVLKQ